MKVRTVSSVFVLLALPMAAFADVDCIRIDGADDWRISIHEDRSMASFFDNDHETAMKMTDVRSLESMPPQSVYTFKGNDEGTKISFNFNETYQTGYLTDSVGTTSEYTVDFSCRNVDGELIDWEETRAALENAKKNGGSTRY
jgi:hypothetical protein